MRHFYAVSLKSLTKSILPFGLIWLSVISSSACAMNVLSSIKPFQMISYEITKGIGQSDSLLNTTASPHDYAMRPSDLTKLHKADLVIWFGKDLEAFLAPILSNNKERKNSVLQVSMIEGLELHKFGEEEQHEHDKESHHHHGSHDPHVWLGPKQAKLIATAIADELSKIDSPNKPRYQENLNQFVTQLDIETKAIQARLTPIQQQPYYVFHDAYGYFERYFGLQPLGHFTVNPERKPGAKTLATIHKTLIEKNVKCVFAEPQFAPATINSIINSTNAKQGILDPLATEVEVKEGSYFTFLNKLADSFNHCLSAS